LRAHTLDALLALASKDSKDSATQKHAIQALAPSADKEAVAKLMLLANNGKNDNAIRRAAYRSGRRSKTLLENRERAAATTNALPKSVRLIGAGS
jgi:hypothetical protein